MRSVYYILVLLLFSTAAIAQIDPRLLTAIQQNNPQAVETALRTARTGAPERRPDPNAIDSLGATPLMWACYKADTLPIIETYYVHLFRNPKHNVRHAFNWAIADLKLNKSSTPYEWAAFVLIE